jgi:SAM-dependent methyltransferase
MLTKLPWLKKLRHVLQIAFEKGEDKMLSMFKEELAKIDGQMKMTQSQNIPGLFRRIPLEVFGKLLLDVPPEYPHIKEYFPAMATEAVQRHWTGAHGEALLNQSVAFMKTMIYGYSSTSGKEIENASVLDYGCGWGRLIRLLYKFVPIDNIYGVDPSDESIKVCEQNGVKGNLAISDYVPRKLPFEQQFDLIFAFSVFTHLSEKTAHIVLDTLRKYVSEGGILIITIRPREYWHVHERVYPEQGVVASKMMAIHDEKGFAFSPHNRPPIDGDITYGDASMTLTYLEDNFPQWKIAATEYNDTDPYQVILFLKPV